MDKVQDKINNLFKEIELNPKKISKILEENFKKTLSSERIREYQRLKESFLRLKVELENISPTLLIAQKIKEIKSSGQDRLLTPDEERIKKNIYLAIEKNAFVAKVSQKVSTEKIKLKSIEYNFDKYTLSNFYRTYCESSVKLFADILLILVDFNLSQTEIKEEYIKNQKKFRRDILNDSIGLDGLRSILGGFVKRIKNPLDIIKTIDNYFLYDDEKGGFSFRNKIAHEKLFFSEMNTKEIIDELLKVNLFNQAFINVFYFSILGDIFTPEDMKLSKDLFGKVNPST